MSGLGKVPKNSCSDILLLQPQLPPFMLLDPGMLSQYFSLTLVLQEFCVAAFDIQGIHLIALLKILSIITDD